MTAALVLRDIHRRFGATLALAGASLTVRSGTVHALLGENGAGKTTLMRIAYGLLSPDAGSIAVGGTPVALTSPADAMRHGIGMVHQHFTFVPAMTVAENVALGLHGHFDAGTAAARVREVGRRTGLVLDPDARAADLSVGAQQRLEIVKALARDVRVLILDEPTAAIAPSESDELLRWVRRFCEEGRAAVLITHKLREARAVADDVTVLHRGITVATGTASAFDEPALVSAMLGAGDATVTPVRDRTHRSPMTAGAPVVLELRNASVAFRDKRHALRDVTLDVHGGEILGVAAVEGAGHHELLRLLSGRLRPTHGTARIPDDVAFVPEDRHRDALVLDMTLIENVALRGAGARRGRIAWRALREATVATMHTFDVRAPGPEALARDLSGGNQQKLVFGRELRGHPAAVVAENPTRGLDIRASAAVHEQLLAARAAGCAVVVYSSDLDEVLALADRTVVVHAGHAREVPATRDAVGAAMLGAG